MKKEYPGRCPCLSHSRRGERRVYGGSYNEPAFLLPRQGAAQRAGRGSASAFSVPGDHPAGSRLRAHCCRRPLRPDGPAPFDRSPLDGYALHSADTAGASRETPVTLPVVMKLYAGDAPAAALPAGCAARIMTGAPCRRVQTAS
ncbi:MAG: hypothetical protein ACLVJH_12255 [Faecalibacterium prausnitzii]